MTNIQIQKQQADFSDLAFSTHSRRHFLSWAIAPLITFGLAQGARAQEQPASAPADQPIDYPKAAPTHFQRLKPSRQEVASISIAVPGHPEVERKRVIIVRGEYEPLKPSDAKAGPSFGKIPYFHTPLPILIAKEDGNLIWHEVQRTDSSGQRCVLTFRMALSSNAFCEKVREKVLSEDAHYLQALRAKPEDVAPYAYPVGSCVIRLQLPGPLPDVLTCATVEGLDFADDEYSFQLSIPAADRDGLESLLRSGEVEFCFNYSFAGHDTAQVLQNVELDKQTMLKIQQMISSKQTELRGPILQNERNDLVNRLSLVVRQDTLIRGREAIPLARTGVDQMLSQIMQEETIRGTEAKALCAQPEIWARLSGYLQALPQELATSEGKFTIHDVTNAQEDVEAQRSGRTLGLSAGIGVNLGYISLGLSASGQWTQEDEKIKRILKAIQDRTGVSFQRVKSTPYFEPHEIHCYQWLANQQVQNISHSTITTLVLGEGEDKLPPLRVSPLMNSSNLRHFRVGVPQGFAN